MVKKEKKNRQRTESFLRCELHTGEEFLVSFRFFSPCMFRLVTMTATRKRDLEKVMI